MQRELELPASKAAGTVTLSDVPCVVIVGANGSGKTRLGTWIEFDSKYIGQVHRVAAHKSLTMPKYTSVISLEQADEILLYGDMEHIKPDARSESVKIERKKQIRWGLNPETHMLDDYEKLMVSLFSDESAVAMTFRHQELQGRTAGDAPKTRLDNVRRIWHQVMPARKLLTADHKIKVAVAGSDKSVYNGSQMSDGERVVFYLIGQVVSAKPNSIIVIDEPELHLHKSIQATLWRAIMDARPDCLFVYMTHDVEFAASLAEARKIWLKGYDGTHWDWEEVAAIDGLPEPLLLQVLGSRRPVLFVEGTVGGKDWALYRLLYPAHTVVPFGSCTQVVSAVRALRQAKQLHHHHIYGIVDRDRLNDHTVAEYRKGSVETLPVAEVESLYCLPEVLELIARQQGLPVAKTVAAFQGAVINELRKSLDEQVAMHALDEIKFQLNRFDGSAVETQNLETALRLHVAGIDTNDIVGGYRRQLSNAVTEGDYLTVLRLFNRKGLAKQFGSIFEVKSISELVLRMLGSNQKQLWADALMAHMPNLDCRTNDAAQLGWPVTS